MKPANIIEKIKKFPQSFGVYIFRDKKGKVVYIGKATNLKSRVGSYFRAVRELSPHKGDLVPERARMMANRPIEMMISEVARVEYQETDTVLEALILESNLIKKHQPKYNVKEKDDKSFSYFVITKEEFPRVLIMRQTDLNLKKLETKNYKLKTIYGPYTSKKQMEIALKIIRKIFPFHSNKNKTEKGCLDFQLGRCPGPYAGAISKSDYAKNIRGIRMILEGKKKNLLKKMEKEMQALAKKEEFEKATEIRNKIFALQHIQDVALINRDDKIQDTRLDSRRPLVDARRARYEFQTSSKNQKPKTTNFRIEAYDISNLSGRQAVGSMVVFENNEPNKKEYRKFRIKSVEGANDVGMMKEVLLRRFKNAWIQPDLIMLDGGLGHLNMAQKLLQELGFVIPIVAVAKGPTRKISNSKFLISKQITMSKLSNEIENILNDKNLIKYITDEAHRFAITYHIKVRKREFI